VPQSLRERFVGRSREYIHPEEGGLRITSAKEARLRPAGNSRAGTLLSGDSQVTATFEVLKVDKPLADVNGAVSVLLMVAGPNRKVRVGWEAPFGGRRVMWIAGISTDAAD
jgi:hypothetical protein